MGNFPRDKNSCELSHTAGYFTALNADVSLSPPRHSNFHFMLLLQISTMQAFVLFVRQRENSWEHFLFSILFSSCSFTEFSLFPRSAPHTPPVEFFLCLLKYAFLALWIEDRPFTTEKASFSSNRILTVDCEQRKGEKRNRGEKNTAEEKSRHI